MTAPLANDEMIAQALTELPGWRRDGDKLRGAYRFPTFLGAVDFTRAVAAVAEELAHHPEWTVRYRAVELATTTHDANGLTTLDVALARRIAALATAAGGILGAE